jgi:histidinol-phosphate/aromatic aminotransferase/cobyric acid decarboxylase-like protein
VATEPGYVVGVGVASAATTTEVAELVVAALATVDVERAEVRAVATVATRVRHPAIVALGWPIVGLARDELGDAVAEPAARAVAGPGGQLVLAKQKSAHATVAVCRCAAVDLPPGEHGGDGPRLAARLGIDAATVLDLSQSLNPVAPDVAAIVAAHADEAVRYPDPTAATEVLATAMAVDPARLVLTNGGAEAIALVAAELGHGWVDEPDFALYRRHLPRLDPDGPRFRSNPHSPTGRLADPTERAEVWDEAFFPLATGRWTSGAHERGAIVVGSMTKTFACPGLRLGYVLTPDDELALALRQRQPVWSVSTIALACVPELLASADLEKWSATMASLRHDLVDVLARHGLPAASADANWVLVDAPHLRDALLAHAIVVRDCASFGLAGTVRIAVPDAAGLERLDRALTVLTG